jgi:hypothetical protein
LQNKTIKGHDTFFRLMLKFLEGYPQRLEECKESSEELEEKRRG